MANSDKQSSGVIADTDLRQFLRVGDGRTREARALKRLRADVYDRLGGAARLSPQQLADIEDYVFLNLILVDTRMRILHGDDSLKGVYIQYLNSRLALANRLGLANPPADDATPEEATRLLIDEWSESLHSGATVDGRPKK